MTRVALHQKYDDSRAAIDRQTSNKHYRGVIASAPFPFNIRHLPPEVSGYLLMKSAPLPSIFNYAITIPLRCQTISAF